MLGGCHSPLTWAIICCCTHLWMLLGVCSCGIRSSVGRCLWFRDSCRWAYSRGSGFVSRCCPYLASVWRRGRALCLCGPRGNNIGVLAVLFLSQMRYVSAYLRIIDVRVSDACHHRDIIFFSTLSQQLCNSEGCSMIPQQKSAPLCTISRKRCRSLTRNWMLLRYAKIITFVKRVFLFLFFFLAR